MGLVNTGIKKYPMCTIKYTAVFLMLWTYISAGGIATGTYFERGGALRNKIGGWGGLSRDKSDTRHHDPKAQFLLIKVSFICLI